MSLETGPNAPVLQARGSLERAATISNPAQGRRLRLLLELGGIFPLAPVLIRYAIFDWRIPLPLVLQPLLLGFILYLLWDPTFHLKSELGSGFGLSELVSILLVFAVVGNIIALFVFLQLPGQFLALPTQRPRLWGVVMIFYPLMSVIPQELIYRTFFFHRYGPLFGDARWLAIAVNGLLFGFAHIIFGSYVSIVLTALLGFLVAWRYERTGSFWGAWVEHSIYGCLIFSIGLGRYFFTGIDGMP